MARAVAETLEEAHELTHTQLEDLLRGLTLIKNSRQPLFRLPGELRNRIWHLALIADIKDQYENLKQRTIASYKSLGVETTSPHDLETRATYMISFSFRPKAAKFTYCCQQMKKETQSIFFEDLMVLTWFDPSQNVCKALKGHLIAPIFYHLHRHWLTVEAEELHELSKKCRVGHINFAPELHLKGGSWTTKIPQDQGKDQ
ncbi:hypothetical protein Slin15195_G037690 [Septoria linicola]|uniref:Uncharacterized protein n=1 Tax=Septoria linicola TaxID=215465 RepID=A0A9Q9AK11_9PEZI|nr:hypothetical protein Slin14017_G119100 [Septoria linicola]USW50450.1 hypothetical protein Slin15195_G037690 [Septoria linicola]